MTDNHNNTANEWIQNCRSLFETLPDTTLEPMTVAQLLTVLATYGVHLDADQLNHFVHSNNPDGGGTLDIVSFMCIINHIASGQTNNTDHLPEDELSWAYSVFADDHGQLTVGQLQQALMRKTDIRPNGLPESSVALLLAANGMPSADPSRPLSREEFIRICVPPDSVTRA